MQPARGLLAWLSLLFLVALGVRFLLAGAGAFGAASWDVHAVVVAVAMMIAVRARRGNVPPA